MGARQGRAARGAELDRVLRSLVEGAARGHRAAVAIPARAAPSGCSAALGASELSLAGAELGAGRIERVEALDVAVSQGPVGDGAVIDSHTHLRSVRAIRRGARRGRRRGGRDADPDRGHRRRLLPRRAGRRGGLPAGLRGDRAPPERGPGLRRRRPRGAARAGCARALRGDRRDRPGLLPRRRARRRPGARLRRADRARARDAQAAGDPLARAPSEQTLAQLAAEAAGRERGDALLLDARAAARSACARGYAISFAGNVTYKSAADARRGRPAGARGAPAGGDRRALPHAAGACASSATSPPSSRTRSAFLAELRGVSAAELGASRERNAARVFGWA